MTSAGNSACAGPGQPSAMRDIPVFVQRAKGELTSEGRFFAAGLVAFLAVAVLGVVDLASDLSEGASIAHVATEGGIALVGLIGATLMTRRLVASARDARRRTAELAARLAETERAAAQWRAEAEEHLEGLGAALDRQFERWSLSGAEKEVALLLLKGLSHKEIADARSISEATARQQARAVYKKAGLSGRHDLAAFFLEDLLLPRKQPVT